MIIYKSAAAIHSYLIKKKSAGKSIGFVPTMGALHEGHLSLITTSRQNNDITVCSIFVNPTQFNNISDFNKYPVTLEKDIDHLEASGCNVIFIPATDEIYIPGRPLRQYELGDLENILEGKYRPGHFQGVCQVVHRLLEIIDPHRLYIGQKDFQQCMVINKLIETERLDVKVQIHPTIRENDGLAMSSRNLRLSEEQRARALKIYEALLTVKKNLRPGNLQELKDQATIFLTENSFKVDYVEIAAARSLNIQTSWDGKLKLVILAAAYLGEIRLIDNLIMD